MQNVKATFLRKQIICVPRGNRTFGRNVQFFVCGVITDMHPYKWAQSELKIILGFKEYRLQDLGGRERVTAEMVDGIKLVNHNAKATNDRAHGEYHTLLFPNFHP